MWVHVVPQRNFNTSVSLDMQGFAQGLENNGYPAGPTFVALYSTRNQSNWRLECGHFNAGVGQSRINTFTLLQSRQI